MDTSHFNSEGHGLALGCTIKDPLELHIVVHDPASTLFQLKDLVWLAIVQLADLRINNTAVQTLPVCLLSEPNIKVVVQVMAIAPVVGHSDHKDGDWEWTGHFVNLAGQNSMCEIDGQWVELLNPAQAPPTWPGVRAKSTYHFHSSKLITIGSLLFEHLLNKSDCLLTIPCSSLFPYWTGKGMFHNNVFLTCTHCLIHR